MKAVTVKKEIEKVRVKSRSNVDSDNVLHLINPGTKGAEIGVWLGQTSMKFLNQGISELHLVDAYSLTTYENTTEFSYDDYYELMSNQARKMFKKTTVTRKDIDNYLDFVYRQVKGDFKDYPHVHVHRLSSDEFFSQNQDLELDWIYIDGDHSYKGCSADLNNALKIVKKGGIIIGDDYGPKGIKPQVTYAVNEFVEDNDLELELHGRTQYSIQL